MVATRLFPIAFALLLSAVAVAQERPASAPAAAAADCTKAMARHDHGAEKGTPTPMQSECAASPASAASAHQTKAKAGHDHAKFHKNQ